MKSLLAELNMRYFNSANRYIKLKIKELKIKGCAMMLNGNQHIGILAH